MGETQEECDVSPSVVFEEGWSYTCNLPLAAMQDNVHGISK